MAEVNYGLPVEVYVQSLKAELRGATDAEHKAAILAELATLGVRSKAVAPKRETR